MKNILLALITFFLILSCEGEPTLKEIHYYDGSNNHYSYIKASSILKYEPVQAEQSSSGIYSGGSTNQWILNASQVKEIEKIFSDIAKQPTDAMDKRVMMSGMIKMVYEDRYMNIILEPHSETKKRIEEFLSSVRSQ